MSRLNFDMVLGVFISLAGLAAILIWVPLDTGTGLVVRVRGSYTIGDALAPTIALALMTFAGLLLVVESFGKNSVSPFTRKNAFYLCILLLLLVSSIMLMRWVGPLTAHLYGMLTGEQIPYRNLRDVAPWKYLGYLSGGTLLVAGLISFIQRRISLLAVAIGFSACLVMIIIYDLPFDTLLLPPNGDV